MNPTFWSEVRNFYGPSLTVNGNGVIHMTGSQPRLYTKAYTTNSVVRSEADQLFVNVVFTGYLKRNISSVVTLGGSTVGMVTVREISAP